MAIHGFLPYINNFTRVTNHFKTWIDHIFIKNINDNKIDASILRCDITDYAAILIIPILNNSFTVLIII